MKLIGFVLQFCFYLIEYAASRHIKTIEIISVEDSSCPKLYTQDVYLPSRGKKQRELKFRNSMIENDENLDILGNNWTPNSNLDDDKVKQIMLNFNLSKVSFVNASSAYEANQVQSSCIYDDINKLITKYWKSNITDASDERKNTYEFNIEGVQNSIFSDFITKWNQTILNSSRLHNDVHNLLYQTDLNLGHQHQRTIHEICQSLIISYFNNKTNTTINHDLLEDCKVISTAYYDAYTSKKGNLINHIQNGLKVKSSHTHQVYKYSDGKMQKQIIKDKYHQYTIINTKIEQIQNFLKYLSNQYIFPKLLIYPYSSILIEVECSLDCYVTVEYNHLLIIKDKLLEFTHFLKSHPQTVTKQECSFMSMKSFITLCYVILVLLCLAVSFAAFYMIYFLIQSPKLTLEDLDVSIRKNASNASKFLNESIV